MADGHVVCWNVTELATGAVIRASARYGFRHLGPVSTNVLVISDPAMLIDGTPEETTFPRPRLSAQSQAKLLSPASACKWAPSQMNASEPRAMQCPGPQLLSTKTAVDCTQGSRAQRLVSR
jgi:hypothetical protein